MKFTRSFALLAALGGFFVAPVHGQGLLAPGQVMGNDTAVARTARPASMSLMFDRAFTAVADNTVYTNGTSWLATVLTAQGRAIMALNSGAGLVAITGAGTATQRAVAGTAAEITVTNGSGAAGNPTLSLPTALTFTGKTVTGGTFSSPAINTPTITGGTFSNVSLSLDNTAAAFELGLISTDATMSANRNLTFNTLNGSRAIQLAGDVALSGSFTTSGSTGLLTQTYTGTPTIAFGSGGTVVYSNVTTLSSLASIGTITTGTWNGTPIAVANGGTGNTSTTAFAVQTGGTTSTGPHQSVSGVGTAGQVLTSNGAGALPSWQAASAGSAPLPTKQVLTSGTGATYTRPSSPAPTYLRVRMVGGGGGGAGSGTTPGAATAGTATVFSTFNANGGQPASTVFGGGGGAASGCTVNAQGGDGNAALNVAQSMGGQGGGSVFGSGGQAGPNGPTAGNNGGAFGSGGGGAGAATIVGAGGGGGSGGYCEGWINSPAATYTYTVGPGGGGGTAGTGGAAGGAGKIGVIIVEEFYNFLLKRDLDPANDNTPAWLSQVA